MNVSRSALMEAFVTGIMVLCAISVAGILVKREFFSTPLAAAPEPEVRADWRDFVDRDRADGADSAEVVVVVFSDYQCPACRALERRFDELRVDDIPGVVIQFRHVPIPRHLFARDAALASECARAQGSGGPMHRLLFEKQDSLGAIRWVDLAERAQVADLPRFERCLASDRNAIRIVTADSLAASQLKLRGTPTLLINDRMILGVPSLEAMREHIESARQSQRNRAALGG